MKIITVCGSVRFKDEMLEYRNEQHKNGNWVLLPENMDIDIQQIDARVKMRMDELHMDKIDCADHVFIWNRNGYIGESTWNELQYSKAIKEPVEFLEVKEYICKCGHSFTKHVFEEDVLFHHSVLVRCAEFICRFYPKRKVVTKLCECTKFEAIK